MPRKYSRDDLARFADTIRQSGERLMNYLDVRGLEVIVVVTTESGEFVGVSGSKDLERTTRTLECAATPLDHMDHVAVNLQPWPDEYNDISEEVHARTVFNHLNPTRVTEPNKVLSTGRQEVLTIWGTWGFEGEPEGSDK